MTASTLIASRYLKKALRNTESYLSGDMFTCVMDHEDMPWKWYKLELDKFDGGATEVEDVNKVESGSLSGCLRASIAEKNARVGTRNHVRGSLGLARRYM